jgi:hypothetical protein
MRSLGVVLFPGFELLDVFGPLEMYGILPEQVQIHLNRGKNCRTNSRLGGI